MISAVVDRLHRREFIRIAALINSKKYQLRILRFKLIRKQKNPVSNHFQYDGIPTLCKIKTSFLLSTNTAPTSFLLQDVSPFLLGHVSVRSHVHSNCPSRSPGRRFHLWDLQVGSSRKFLPQPIMTVSVVLRSNDPMGILNFSSTSTLDVLPNHCPQQLSTRSTHSTKKR